MLINSAPLADNT